MACIPLYPRTLSDIGHSTAANNAQASALFSTPKNPQRIPANTPPVFRGLRPRICPSLLRLVTNVNAGQAPSFPQNPPDHPPRRIPPAGPDPRVLPG